MMPDMDGWEVYQQMKADEKTRDIPVIVVTAKAQSIDKVLGLHIAKVDDYIAKPFSPQELARTASRECFKRRLRKAHTRRSSKGRLVFAVTTTCPSMIHRREHEQTERLRTRASTAIRFLTQLRGFTFRPRLARTKA
ncbi:MAG: response regulator [Candidatus Moduliflexus flocculans]|nr:response regulator [Candidatus Moduliflexus flocculans]